MMKNHSRALILLFHYCGSVLMWFCKVVNLTSHAKDIFDKVIDELNATVKSLSLAFCAETKRLKRQEICTY